MKRSTKLVVGITTAAITFASLMAFTGGKHHFNHQGKYQHGYYKEHDCRGAEDANKYRPATKQESKTMVADSAKAGQ